MITRQDEQGLTTYAEIETGFHEVGGFEVEIRDDQIYKVRVIDWDFIVHDANEDELAAIKDALNAKLTGSSGEAIVKGGN